VKQLPEDLFLRLPTLKNPDFDHLEVLNLSDTSIQNRDLGWLFIFRRGFIEFRYILFARDSILELYKGTFTHLVELSLAGTQIGDPGLAYL
jgi:hypothetical protein